MSDDIDIDAVEYLIDSLRAENARLLALARELAEALQAIHTGHAFADDYRDHLLRRDDVRVLLDREDAP